MNDLGQLEKRLEAWLQHASLTFKNDQGKTGTALLAWVTEDRITFATTITTQTGHLDEPEMRRFLKFILASIHNEGYDETDSTKIDDLVKDRSPVTRKTEC